jgi:hypothetical protein
MQSTETSCKLSVIRTNRANVSKGILQHGYTYRSVHEIVAYNSVYTTLTALLSV